MQGWLRFKFCARLSKIEVLCQAICLRLKFCAPLSENEVLCDAF